MRSGPISRIIAVLATVALLGACSAQPPEAQEEPPPKAAHRVEQDKRILRSDAALERLLDPAKPGCSAAVAVRGEVLWAGASGLADRKAETPLTTETRFDMASVAKQFTATAILMLEREGSLSLDDSVAEYVDGLPAWGRIITLKQLMHHTSHIRDYWQRLQPDGLGFGDHVGQADTVRAIAGLPTLEPGSGYLYSNSNYVLLAEVVRRVSGQKLPVFLQERIFAPLDLRMELKPNLEAPDVALSYDDDNNHQVSGWSAFGAVGIFTTPTELARWADQYRAGSIVQADYAEDAVKSDEGKYGAGINLRRDGSLGHDGRFAGYISAFELSPDRETAIVVMCNGHKAPRWPLDDALHEIWLPPLAP